MKHLFPFVILFLLVSCGSNRDDTGELAQNTAGENHSEENTHSILAFDDGSSVALRDKYMNYSDIDSIRCFHYSFEAIYHSCGKGRFGFSKEDLKHIKNVDLQENIAYYCREWDFDENNMPEEPTAVLLSQRGEEFYLNTLKNVDNACSLPQNTPVTCKAYCLEVFTKEGAYNEVVIYEMNILQK